MAASENNDRRAAALAYLERGWSVIPVLPRGKRPLIAWRPFQGRCASIEEVRCWFDCWPDANVAIVTGRLSRLVVVDVDPRRGGTESLVAFEAEHGVLSATFESLTGGGGRPLYFRHPGTRTANRVGLRPGIDLRGDGGCVVAPPSVHPSGQRCTWRAECSPTERPAAAMPQCLVSAP
jgi:hypothetical protein